MSATRLLLVIAVWLAWAEMSWMAPAAAQDALPIEVRTVEIGYGGVYKSGFWTPIWVTLHSAVDVTGKLEVVAPDGDGAPVAYSAAASGSSTAGLTASRETTVMALVKIGPERSGLSIRLRDAERDVVTWQSPFPETTPRPLPSTRELVVSLGGFTAADSVKLMRRQEAQRPVAANIDDRSRVPEVWWGWDGVETIVISTAHEGLANQLSSKQYEALRQWVEIGGGRLVICAGERGGELLASGQPLAELVPGKLVNILPLRDLAKLEELGGEPFSVTSDAARPQVAHLSDVRGQVELTVAGLTGDAPLLVRASLGMGEVAFLALDPADATLAQWPGRAALLLPALAAATSARGEETRRQSTSRLGYDDLSGQLRTALGFFPGVRVVSVTTVAMLTLTYLMLIGPVAFLMARQLRRSAVWSWLFFPLLVLAFCAVGWYVRDAAHGSAMAANVCEVIDIDRERQVARGTTWLQLYSPRTSTHNLSLTVDARRLGVSGPVRGWASWQGLPGEGLGGLGANQIATPALTSYSMSPPGHELALFGVPIQTGGSKAMEARWWADCELGEVPPLSLNQYHLLEGEIVNPLSVELIDSLLVYDEWMYRLHTLSPRQRVRLDEIDPLNLEARLQRRTVANAKDVLSPWERDSIDVPRIVQMMMFHESARGTTYTNLSHRYQGYLDLTPRARNGVAVLMGRIARPVTSLTVDGAPLTAQNDEWTFVRILCPVTPRP